MIISIIQYFWPSISKEDARKFGLLALGLLCLIGCYWMLRILKDIIFFKIAFPEYLGWAAKQGTKFQPKAKIYSLFVVFCSILAYTPLVDRFKKHQLFYIVGSVYAFLFACVAGVLYANQLGMLGTDDFARTVLATTGWASYFSIESFGSVMIPLFWAFVVSITKTEAAKVGFPIIVAGAQIGSIAGSGLNIIFSRHQPALLLLGVALIFTNMYIIHYFIQSTPAQLLEGNKVAEQHDKVHAKETLVESLLSGIRLLFTRSYLFGVLLCSTLYEVVVTINDFQMKALGDQIYGKDNFAEFLGWFGVATNGLAFLLALLGTSYVMKRYGLKFCLLLYPAGLGVALAGLYVYSLTIPTDAAMLIAIATVVILGKGLSYAVNNPAKEMMYIPTSKDVKFKAKGWIDMFGGRSAKAGGSAITDALKESASLMGIGTAISLGLIGALWIPAAMFVGNKNEQLIKNNDIIE
jgi:ATP:ADP antiporter, AAA family